MHTTYQSKNKQAMPLHMSTHVAKQTMLLLPPPNAPPVLAPKADPRPVAFEPKAGAAEPNPPAAVPKAAVDVAAAAAGAAPHDTACCSIDDERTHFIGACSSHWSLAPFAYILHLSTSVGWFMPFCTLWHEHLVVLASLLSVLLNTGQFTLLYSALPCSLLHAVAPTLGAVGVFAFCVAETP